MTTPSTSVETKAISRPVPMERHRFHLLDAMRGLAAMLVVTFHAPLQLETRLRFPNSFLAVDFFFCLSGFVIGFSYEERLRAALTFRDFFVVRIIRLYPLYVLSMLISMTRNLVSPLMFREVHSALGVVTLIGLSFFMIPNVFIAGVYGELFPLNPPTWSLFLELVANAVYAWLIIWKKARPILPLLYLASLTVLVFAVAHGSAMNIGAMKSDVNDGYARVGLSFLAGIFLYRAFRRKTATRLTGPVSWLASAAAVSLLIAAITITTPLTATGSYQLFVAAILFPALVYLGAHCTLPRALNPLCAFLGDMSYPLYILHVPLMVPYHNLEGIGFLRRHHELFPWLVPSYLIFLVLLAWWVGKYVDLPIRKRLTSIYKNFVKQSSAPQPSTI